MSARLPRSTDAAPTSRGWIFHFAAQVAPDGRVRPLCNMGAPRVVHVQLRRASWTTSEHAVTCRKCKAAIRDRRAREAAEQFASSFFDGAAK